jgi:hypothetical protein
MNGKPVFDSELAAQIVEGLTAWIEEHVPSVEIHEHLNHPATCKVWIGGVLRFIGTGGVLSDDVDSLDDREGYSRLRSELARLGDDYGPLGVALAAAGMTDRALLIHHLTEERVEQADQSPSTLAEDIAVVLNRHSVENRSDTPDFILAEAVVAFLLNIDWVIAKRGDWYAHHCKPGKCHHGEVGE